jgi:hypothetical protein
MFRIWDNLIRVGGIGSVYLFGDFCGFLLDFNIEF